MDELPNNNGIIIDKHICVHKNKISQKGRVTGGDKLRRSDHELA
jgi:hypothetical protein